MVDFQISQGLATQGKIQYQRGNLVDAFISGRVDHLIHGSNCFCTMGAGIAATVKSRLPEMYEADCQTIKGDERKLGSFSFCEYNGRYGFNSYIQYLYGSAGPYIDYVALRASLLSISEFLEEMCGYGQPQIIGIPMIGCGLAGGVWNVVEAIVKDALESHCVYVYMI